MKSQLYRLLLLFILTFCVNLITSATTRADEPNPPFFLKITPTYQDGKITYDLRLSSLVEWDLVDVTIRFTLPMGSRYVSGEAPATTTVQFDGQNVLFFTSVFHKPLRGAVFTIEPIDLKQTVFTSQVEITWKGQHANSYTMPPVEFDITKTPLGWDRPQLPIYVGFMATVNSDDTITYSLYPQSFSALRMWDLRVNVALPTGMKFISAENPPQFGHTFDGQVVYFLASEMPKETILEPLRFKVSTAGLPDNQLLTTHAWVSWKNAGRGVGEWIVAEENFTTGDLKVMPRVPQFAVADMVGDVPLSNYDLTSLKLQDKGASVQLSFNMVGAMRPTDPLVYQFFIDNDCRVDTGFQRDGRGMEYRLRFNNLSNKTDFMAFNSQKNDWDSSTTMLLSYEINGPLLTIDLPYILLRDNKQFCWSALLRNDTKEYTPDPPSERVPELPDLRLTQYRGEETSGLAALIDEALKGQPVIVISLKPTAAMTSEAKPINKNRPTITPTPTLRPKPNEEQFILLGDEWQYQPGWSQPPSDWAALAFDDSPWATGRTTLGYGDMEFKTDLSLGLTAGQQPNTTQMEQPAHTPPNPPAPRTDFNSFYMRHHFTVQKVSNLIRLILKIDYEDGFVAYLNGQEVARRGLKSPGTLLSFNSAATDREGGLVERIDLTDFIPKLSEGDNILALEIHRSLGRSNLYAAPELTWQRQNKAVITPTPTVTPTQLITKTRPTVTPTATSMPMVNSAAITNPTVIIPTPLSPTATPIPTAVQNIDALPPLPLEPLPQTEFLRPNPNPSIIDANGKIAIPLDDGQGFYNVHVFTVRFGYGWESDLVPRARQPHFSPDGQRMLFNRDGDAVANIMEYDFATKSDRRVSDNPLDGHPFYDLSGTRVVYDNPALDIDPNGRAYSHLVVQCSLLPPSLEPDPRCHDVAAFGVIIPAGQMGRVEGQHPVWGSNDMIIYQGCDSWVGGASCGIYSVGSWATKSRGDGAIPTRLTDNTSDIPTDTHAYHVAFMSQREGNWEVYVMTLDGGHVLNLSNNPGANDGLPTLSPDGSWVAFVSDREGGWAAWAVPLVGGTPQKLFDLPSKTPWASQERSWTNERISWGP